MVTIKWDEMKTLSDRLSIPIIWREKIQNNIKTYELTVVHKSLIWGCTLTQDSEDVEIVEFETNYKGVVIERWVSEKVNALTETSSYYVPPLGSKIKILSFHAEAPFDANAVCKLLWDYNEAEETSLWSTQGSSEMPFKPTLLDTDGVKKLAVSCDNGTLGALLMSAYVKILVINGGE